METIFSIPVSADPASDTGHLIEAAIGIQNADYTIERYENLLKHNTDPRLRRHYNFCINKAGAIRARIVAGINI